MNKGIEYRIGCIDHFRRAENLLKNSLPKENKFYAALELRYSIERFLFEWLYILKYKVYDITKKDEALYRAKDLRKQIEKTAPDFYERIDFLNLWFEAQGLSHRVEKPNWDLLCKLWARLGNYLHAQKEPKETVEREDWWVKFDGLLLETRTELEKALKKDRATLRLNYRGIALYELFRTGKYTKQQMIDMIRIDTVSPIRRLH